MNPHAVRPETAAAQALGWIDESTRAISPAIHPSTTYLRDEDNQYRSGRLYARDNNPSFDQAEALLTHLEKGHATALFSSGMAAATAVFLACRPPHRFACALLGHSPLVNWFRDRVGIADRVCRNR
jgi:cystathionine gamma-synthase